MKKETHVNFLTDPHERRPTFKLIDILVYRCVREKHVCVKLIVVSPLLRPGTRGFIMGYVLLKSALSQVIKH